MKPPTALRFANFLCLAAAFGLATAQANNPPITLSVTPASAGGAEQRFTFEYADNDGPGDIAQAQVVINTYLDGANGCYFIYVRDTNSVVLANENGYGPYGSVPVGTPAVLGHARCLIREAAIRWVGNSLLLDITVRFLWDFNGRREIYLLAIDSAGAAGGWDWRGFFQVNVANSPPSTTSTTPNSGSGMSQRFEFRYADPNGYSDVASAQVIINTQLNGASACYILYDRPTRTVVLARDDGWGAAGSLSLVGNPGLPVSNLQCTIRDPLFTVLGVNEFAFSVQVDFTTAFASSPAKTIWMLALDTQPLQGGWDQRGTWTVSSTANQPPQVVSESPASGAGLGPQAFQFTYADPNGYADLASAYARFNASPSDIGACSFRYDRASNTIFLYNDAGTGWVGSVPLGYLITNSQCTIMGGTATPSGSSLALSLTISFNAGFAGAKNVYMQALDTASASSGWQSVGIWTVPGGCQIDAWVYKGTSRDSDNSMRGYAYAYCQNRIGLWTARVFGDFYFKPSGGSPTLIASGSGSGLVVSGIPNDPNNPKWQSTVDLESRGNGSYYMVGSAIFYSECGGQAVVPPLQSQDHPVSRPVITGLPYNQALWHLGPGTPDVVQSSGANYYQTATLSVDRKCARPEDNCSATPQWSILQGDTRISLSCTSCSSPVVRSIAPGNCRYDSTIQVSIGGFKSLTEILAINSPTILVKPAGYTDYSWNWGTGYETSVHWAVADACNPANALLSLPLHEEFGQFSNPGVISGWPDPAEQGLDYFPDGLPYVFIDKIAAAGASNVPSPSNPPPVSQQPSGYSTQLIKYGPQQWFVGSKNRGNGTLVFNGTIYYYIDHGDSR